VSRQQILQKKCKRN